MPLSPWPTLAEQTDQRLTDAGFEPGDPALARIRAMNAWAAAKAAEHPPTLASRKDMQRGRIGG